MIDPAVNRALYELASGSDDIEAILPTDAVSDGSGAGIAPRDRLINHACRGAKACSQVY
jgi:hypothetical protein